MSEDDVCPNVERCELFPKLKTEAALEFCLEQYCHGEYTSCARYQYAKEHKARPPITLLPNGNSQG